MKSFYHTPQNMLVLEYMTKSDHRRADEKRQAQQQAWIRLNNLYLSVERGETRMTIHVSNELRSLPHQAYDRDDRMISYWEQEFQNLPNWNNF